MDADPTLPPALALAPPAVALVLLDVAIYRRQKKSKNRSLRSIDRAIGNGEEEIREDDENGKGETYWRLQPALLLSGGRRLVAGDSERRRRRASDGAVRLCVRGGEGWAGRAG